MLSRHFYRAKALQAVYAFRTSGSVDTAALDKSYTYHINHLNLLATLQLDALLRFVSITATMQLEAKSKFMPTPDELNPSPNLSRNAFIARLQANYELSSRLEAVVPVPGVDAILRKASRDYRETTLYKQYAALPKPTFADDKEQTLCLYKFLMNNEPLTYLFASRSLLWEGDYHQVAQQGYALLRTVNEDSPQDLPMPPVYDQRVPKERDDYLFGRQLMLETVHQFDSHRQLIEKHLHRWEYERISLLDLIIINMAIVELTTCPTIPALVTIDEYVELAKEFSSDKSRLFVNGIIDHIVADLRNQHLIEKD